MEQRQKRGFWYGFNIAAITLIALFLLGVPFLHAVASFVQSVDLRAVQNDPAFVHVPTAFTVEISNEEASPLNAIEFELSYDPNAVVITGITPHATLCEEQFIISNRIHHASGTALFQCGTVTPFSGVHGVVATVHAMPLQRGTTTISFGSTTHALAHDGYGTDKTRDLYGLVLSAI